MFKRMELFNIASVFLLITSIILIIYTMEREREFKRYSSNIQEASVHGAAYSISLQLQNKHHHVRLFLEEYAQLFSYLERYPDDEITLDSIRHRLKQRFSDFFTFTITNSDGIPLITDFESLVGDVCQQDLNDFAGSMKRNEYSLHNEAYVHPQPYHYHYDIMAPLQTSNSGVRVFFTSFYLNEITDILKIHEVPGQTLMLVRQSVPDLIEVSRNGARDKLSRDSNLSEDERSRITIFEDIPDTDWRLINLPDEDFEKDYIHGLWNEMITVLIIVALALMILVIVLVRNSEKKVRELDK